MSRSPSGRRPAGPTPRIRPGTTAHHDQPSRIDVLRGIGRRSTGAPPGPHDRRSRRDARHAASHPDHQDPGPHRQNEPAAPHSGSPSLSSCASLGPCRTRNALQRLTTIGGPPRGSVRPDRRASTPNGRWRPNRLLLRLRRRDACPCEARQTECLTTDDAVARRAPPDRHVEEIAPSSGRRSARPQVCRRAILHVQNARRRPRGLWALPHATGPSYGRGPLRPDRASPIPARSGSPRAHRSEMSPHHPSSSLQAAQPETVVPSDRRRGRSCPRRLPLPTNSARNDRTSALRPDGTLLRGAPGRSLLCYDLDPHLLP